MNKQLMRYTISADLSRVLPIVWAAIAFSSAFPAAAQIAGAGSIQGVVTDPSGAVISGASVSATDVARGVKTQRLSTGAGLFNLSPLNPGEYTVTVSATGFETAVR